MPRRRAVKVLIVDDEPCGRAALRELCADSSDIVVIGEAASGRAALAALEEHPPDLFLLDIGLPDMSGLDVLRASRDEHGPLAILVTAHDDHAIAAFAAGALDYLMKPVSASRFAKSMERARSRLKARESAAMRSGDARTEILVGEKDRRLYPLNPAHIDYIESDGNYVTFRTKNADYLSRDSLKRLAVALAPAGFVRIERSLLLNIHAVMFAEPAGHGTFAFTLASGTVLQSSGIHRQEILQAIPLTRGFKSTVGIQKPISISRS